jgi:hypothetical protein
MLRAFLPFCALNYDHLLERVIGLPAIKLSETDKATAWMRLRRERPGVGNLHLHGSRDVPGSCILGIRDLIQSSPTSFSRLLFIGCGDTFADPTSRR